MVCVAGPGDSPLFDGIREKWIDQGRTERTLELAEKMLLSGIDVDAVVNMTDLDQGKVEDLKKKLKH